jgi:hypothetical protein
VAKSGAKAGRSNCVGFVQNQLFRKSNGGRATARVNPERAEENPEGVAGSGDLFAVFIQIRGGEHSNAKSGRDGNNE